MDTISLPPSKCSQPVLVKIPLPIAPEGCDERCTMHGLRTQVLGLTTKDVLFNGA